MVLEKRIGVVSLQEVVRPDPSRAGCKDCCLIEPRPRCIRGSIGSVCPHRSYREDAFRQPQRIEGSQSQLLVPPSLARPRTVTVVSPPQRRQNGGVPGCAPPAPHGPQMQSPLRLPLPRPGGAGSRSGADTPVRQPRGPQRSGPSVVCKQMIAGPCKGRIGGLGRVRMEASRTVRRWRCTDSGTLAVNPALSRTAHASANVDGSGTVGPEPIVSGASR